MNKLEKKLEEFAAYLKIIEHYRNVGSLMYWDMSTGMPENAAEGRAETMSFMQMQEHNLSVAKEVHDFIKFFEKNEEKLDFVQKRMLHELKKNYEKEKIFLPHGPDHNSAGVRGAVSGFAGRRSGF